MSIFSRISSRISYSDFTSWYETGLTLVGIHRLDLIHRPSVFRTLVLLCPGRASHSPRPHAARCARAAALGALYKSNNVQW